MQFIIPGLVILLCVRHNHCLHRSVHTLDGIGLRVVWRCKRVMHASLLSKCLQGFILKLRSVIGEKHLRDSESQTYSFIEFFYHRLTVCPFYRNYFDPACEQVLEDENILVGSRERPHDVAGHDLPWALCCAAPHETCWSALLDFALLANLALVYVCGHISRLVWPIVLPPYPL